MSRPRAAVRDGVLTIRDGAQDQVIPVGSAAWVHWLEQPDVVSFRVEDGVAPFTARRQAQRGRWYWYAYRRRAGRLQKLYLGRSRDLTEERLEAARSRFAAGTGAAPGAGRKPVQRDPRSLLGFRHNLPEPLSSFVGRRAETAEVRHLLEGARLVTLSGTGGVGKTRLALRVAAEIVEERAVATWLVELAPLSDPLLVPQAVARAAGIRDVAGQSLLITLAAAFGAGRALLVLDNCEHLVEACAGVAENLLRACPEMRVLATSREPLGVPGEVTWRVPSLEVPDRTVSTDQVVADPPVAVQLVVERARAVRPGFALNSGNAPAVVDICRRLDGIPLALELAAAHFRILEPEELAGRLDEWMLLLAGEHRSIPQRHRTLRIMIDWSHDLLTESERRCFAWLSVFAGGFTLEAAAGIFGGMWDDAGGVLAALTRLVDRSLVQVEHHEGRGTRYRLLEVLRAYGSARLAERGETDDAQSRHAAWFLGQAEAAAQAFHGPDQGSWLRWTEREHDNITAALAWAVGRRETELATRLMAAVSWSWLLHQRWNEGLTWARRVLALPAAQPNRDRGNLLSRACTLAIFRGDLTSNRPDGELAEVRHWVDECVAIGAALNDDEITAAGHGLRELLREYGVPVGDAPEMDREAELERLRRLGHTWGMRRCLEATARDALRRGELDVAGGRLREAIDLARIDGDWWSLAIGLNELGDVERARGRHSRARPLYDESTTLLAGLGLGDQPSLLHNLAYIDLAAGDLAGAAARFTAALTQFRRLGARRGVAECLIGLGAVAVAERRLEDAGRLFGAGEAGLAALDMSLWPANRPDVERWLGRAQASREAHRFERARAESRATGPEQPIIWDDVSDRFPVIEQGPAGAVSLLTPRERAVAELAAAGLSNRQIAAALAISAKTAANHMQRVLEKLDLRARAQLAARASELGIAATEPLLPQSGTVR